MAWKHEPVPYDEWNHNATDGNSLNIQPVGGIDLTGIQEVTGQSGASPYQGPVVQLSLERNFGYLLPNEARLMAAALSTAADEAERRGRR